MATDVHARLRNTLPAILWTYLAVGLEPAVLAAQSVARAGIAELSVSQEAPGDISPVFLSDNRIALLIRSGRALTGTSRLAVLRLTSGKLQYIASASKVHEDDKLYAAMGSRALLLAPLHKYIYSPDLTVRQDIPIRIWSKTFLRSNVIGEVGTQSWKAWRLSFPMTEVKKGSGQLLALSDSIVIIRHDDELTTEEINGRRLGSFSVTPDTRGASIAESAGGNRLLLSAGFVRVTDFNGKEIQTMHPPEGWGSRHGWSSDGTRLLFDNFTTRLSPLDKALSVLGDFFGMVIPEQSNGEAIELSTR